VGFDGLPMLGQPSPNRPSAVRNAHSAARRGRASHSHLRSKACVPTPRLAQSAASVATCPGRPRVAIPSSPPGTMKKATARWLFSLVARQQQLLACLDTVKRDDVHQQYIDSVGVIIYCSYILCS
jgi:hypothetical protein